MKIIGLSGKSGAGKDTVAMWLGKRYNLLKVAFADELKHIVQDLFNVDVSQVGKDTPITISDKSWENIAERFRYYSNGIIEKLFDDSPSLRKLEYQKDLLRFFDYMKDTCEEPTITPRTLCIELGSWVRHRDKNAWVKYLYNVSIPQVYKYCPINGFVVTDHRYVNEVEETKKKGGKVFRIERPGNPKQPTQTESEISLDNYTEFDGIITLPEGLSNISKVLEGVKFFDT